MTTVQMDLFGKPVKSKSIEQPLVVNITNHNIPFFVKIDGCINCENYKDFQKNKVKATPHEHTAMCVLICGTSYSIYNPYIGNHELITFVETKKFLNGIEATEENLKNALKILKTRGVNGYV